MGATGFARFDADDRLVWANAAFSASFGSPADATLAGLLIGALGEAGLAALRRGGPVTWEPSGRAALTLALGDGTADERLLTAVECPAAPASVPAAEADGPWARTSLVLDCLSQGVMAFDRDLRLVAWNRRVLELLSIDPAFPRHGQPYEAVVRHIARQGGYGAGDVEELVAQRLDYIRKASWPFYNERVRPDGAVIETVTLPLPDGGFVTTYTDITQRKQAERELAASRELFELAIRAAREGISQWDLRTGEVWFSPQWWGLLGYGDGEADNSRRRWETLIHPDDRSEALAMMEEVAAGRRTESRLLQRFRHRAGGTVYLETRSISVPGGDGRPFRIVGSHTDVTESVRAAEAVRAAKEEAEQALQDLKEAQVQLIQAEKMAALGSLVAGVTHEINTPVGIALTGASLLAEKTRTLRRLYQDGALRRGDFADFIDVADEATQLMLFNIERATRLIQSFKQVAVDQSSEERRVFDLGHYIHEVLHSIGMRIRRSGHAVTVHCPEGLMLDSYPGALGQILTNFVLNSILHGYAPGERGHLDIDVTLVGAEVELVYADDGRGIPADVQGRVFEPFFTTSRERGGSGLGLSIVYTLVTRNLRGRLRLDSTDGAGTAFILRFPRVTPSEPPPL
ncbi:PAS-domain containing protein [Azospirillum picis]|uniref:histidine kinase n=1 Tax=Azospirillum picis TaxID=488438 RepID=A0ABU0MUE6_9PROT|nr:PAS-domain containing protein [Azospirillum picis]MBP2303258.1 PAS domain S-box-containing protein [Azospirillum picis]MDQ0537118.1 PAS domain S-box-containing protein [Azospirillum picis]